MFRRLANILAILWLCVAPAWACSLHVNGTADTVPEDPRHYIFFGEVTGYASVQREGCHFLEDGAECPPSWGIQLKVLLPIQMPQPVATVEYFEFGFGSMCEASPVGKEWVMESFPIGTRLGIAASVLDGELRSSGPVRLTFLAPPVWAAWAVLPKGTNLARRAAMRFDYVSRLSDYPKDENLNPDDDPLVRFELRRDKARLHQARSRAEKLEILLRMAAAGNLSGSDLQSLLKLHLRTTADEQEFERRLRDLHYDNGVMQGSVERMAVARERIDRGEPRAMFEYVQLLPHQPGANEERDFEISLDWLRRSARGGYVLSAGQFHDLVQGKAHRPDVEQLREEAARLLKAAEPRALAAAKRGDPSAYLFLADLYSNRLHDLESLNDDASERQIEAREAAMRRKARRFSCLLAAHPEKERWMEFSTSAWWYVECEPPARESNLTR